MAKKSKTSSDTEYNVAKEEVRQFIERGEQLARERKDISEQEKELWAEAKARGLDPKVMKKVMALRARNPDEIAEEEMILDVYKAAMDM